jgi:hypothetical protein
VTEKTSNLPKKNGRPAKGDGPKVNYQELDRLLVLGELANPPDGGEPAVFFPSYRELAKRYGVSHSVVADYAKKHDCLRRRERAQERLLAKTEEKLLELRAEAIAFSKGDAVATIDSYLAHFREAVADGRVRVDNPTDFNTMLRLKEFILGGADSRQEVHAALSLEDLQARHREMLKAIEASNEDERGSVLGDANSLPAGEQREDQNPPPPSFATGPGKQTAPPPAAEPDPPPDGDDEAAVAAHVGPSGDEEDP